MKDSTKVSSNGVSNSVAVKRKNANSEDEPQTKRNKNENWFPGKFVLLRPPITEDSDESTSNSTPPKKKEKLHLNGESGNPNNQTNGKSECKKKSESSLKKLYDDDSSESGEEWTEIDEELDLESSEEDEVGEEWSTDTDYSELDSELDSEGDSLEEEEHSFHESDCESVSDLEDLTNADNWDDDTSDDSDYVPEVEDKYISLGEAIIYDAKGLNLAFGNSFDSQIIEITDIYPAIMPQDEEVPTLIAPEASDDITVEESPVWRRTSLIHDATSLINGLNIEEDDEGLKSAELFKYATFFDCTANQGVVLKLTNTIHFHGILIVRAIANSVQVNGYTLQLNEVITATSISRADYFLNLTPVVGGNISIKTLYNTLKELITDDNATTLVNSFNPKTEAIVHLQQGLPDTTVEMLKNYSTNALLPSKKMILNNSSCQSSELLLSAKFFVGSENQKINSFELNAQWNHVEVTTSSRLVVIGGKNVGKSGVCQFLINKNIVSFKKILLIDLDIGQPICGPSQTISATVISKPIIGPGYLSDNQPDKSFMYGDKSVMIAPFKYVRCVRQLMEFCVANPNYQSIPWVINTMGYQKGFGLQLVCLLTRILQPTDVVQVQHGIKSYNFSKILTEEVVNALEFSFFDVDDIAGVPKEAFFTTHVLDSIVNNRENDSASKWISNSSEKRKLSMLAQLAKLLKGNQTSLNDVTPFVAPITKSKWLCLMKSTTNKRRSSTWICSTETWCTCVVLKTPGLWIRTLSSRATALVSSEELTRSTSRSSFFFHKPARWRHYRLRSTFLQSAIFHCQQKCS